MKITTKDKIATIFSVYGILRLLPSFKKKISLFFRPIDAVRYTEFSYLYKYIKKNGLSKMSILDISSPYIMAYVFSKKNKVIKTDIDSKEKNFIKEHKNLIFRIEDATKLTFTDNTFDLVYSISVIEHIFIKYKEAIREMLRVTKVGGYVYLTFPVAATFKEEWSEGEVYEMQHKVGGKTFFQYRFDEANVEDIIKDITEYGGFIVERDIFWEAKDGKYDELVEKIKYQYKNKYVNYIKNIIVNGYYGCTLFKNTSSTTFKHATSFGNMHLLIKKTKQITP